MEQNSVEPAVDKESLWYLDNYILLKDYYDRTISRIAARCVRMGNIAIEEYPFYSYILDVLEEISETGEYVFKNRALYPYIEKKIPGGMEAFKKSLREYKQELKENSSPDMLKDNTRADAQRMKAAFSKSDKAADPTVGAGMNMDQLMEKLTKGNQAAASRLSNEKADVVEDLSATEQANLEMEQRIKQEEQQRAQELSEAMGSSNIQPQPQAQAPLQAQPQAPVQGAPKKLIKIKRVAAEGSAQAVPPKAEVSE